MGRKAGHVMTPGGGDDAEDRGARRVARWIVGALGVAGALVAFAALPLPWYTLKSGSTFTGLDLLRANRLAYSAGYIAGYTPLAGDPTTCMSGVIEGISLPIALTLAVCVALLLVALTAIWRAPRGRWGQANTLVWVVGGWMTLFFLFPWITALVNVDPYRVHGYSVEIGVASLCTYPGVSDYGQTALQLGLALVCVAGLLYGLLYLPSASRMAQLAAIIGIVAYLVPSSLSPLAFAGIQTTLSIGQIAPLVLLLLLIPITSALAALALARVCERRGTTATRRWLAVVCLVGAPLGALIAAFAAWILYFSPGIVIIGPGINLLFLSDALLFVAGIRGMARVGPDARRPWWSRRERDEAFWQARLGGKEPWPLP
jgi:hypothetical protein